MEFIKEGLHELLTGTSLMTSANNRRSPYYNYFLKINSGKDDVDLVYRTESGTEGVLGVSSKLELIGIYSKNRKTFYNIGLYEINDTEEVKDLKILDIKFLVSEVYEKVRGAIIDKVNSKIYEFSDNTIKERNKKHLDTIIIPHESKILFLKSLDLDKYDYAKRYQLPSINYSQELYIKYLYDAQEVIESEATNFIENKKELIAEIMVEKEIEEMKTDKKMLNMKEIYSILNSEKMKTVNVTFNNGKETRTFKINTIGDYNNFTISEYDLTSSKDTSIFREMFKDRNYSDAHFDDIVEISYGRKIIYKK